MFRKLCPAFLCLVILLPGLGAALAQETETPPVTTSQEGEETTTPEEEYRVKAYTIEVFGGLFSGGKFFELQPLEARTYLEEGSNEVWRYDGRVFTPQELHYYDAPQKKIDSGMTYGGRIGMYLSESFHIDLVATVSKAKAVTSFLNVDPTDDLPDHRVVLDEDKGFTVYQGGGNLVYEATTIRLMGVHPFVGFGIGGIINRFTELPDKTALYFRLLGGFAYEFRKDLSLYTEFAATTFSFKTEELTYGHQVTYANLFLGLRWMINVVPD